MEEKINLILEKLNRLERVLIDIKDESIKEFLDDNTKESFIGVNIKMIYEAYKNVTNGTATSTEFNNAVKKYYGLRMRHTTKNRENIYYWGE